MEKNNKLNPFVRIRGVKGRGEEVIAELEERGGKTTYITGESERCFYYVDADGLIDEVERESCSQFLLDNYEEITLPRWRAEEGGIYYYIDSKAEIVSTIDSRTYETDVRYEIGNYARTVKELLPYAEKMKEIFKDRR